jgi:hypothetical protein
MTEPGGGGEFAPEPYLAISASWDEISDAEERGWGEGDESMADIIPDDWCGEAMT